MFGYITICEPELKVKHLKRYKAYYCGLCRTLKERYGSLGQITLTYDMTFLILLLTSLYESETTGTTRRCKVHPVKQQNMLQNEITEYAADINVILAYYHMEDNWKDEKKPGALIGRSVLHPKAAKAMERYPRQSEVIREELQKLAAFEEEGTMDIDKPAGCFGRLMAEIFILHKDQWEEKLRRIGFFLGKFIYIMDAYDDLEKDLEEGSYNPLKELSQKADYEEVSGQMLCMMIAECSAEFEKLPCILEVDILRNILYDGVWNRYHKLQEKKKNREEQAK